MNRRSLVVAAVLAGCFDPAAPAGVPCADNDACPSGQQCDLVTRVCMDPTSLTSWRDDSAADFDQPGRTLTDAVIEPNGAIAPMPYLTGRVRLAAIAADTIGADPAAATWETTSAGPLTGRGFAHGFELAFGDAIPPGLGLTTGDSITLLVEGEMYLDVAGTWRFRLTANDKGFVDVAPPSGTFSRLLSDVNAGAEADLAVAAPGWYRVRGAFTDVTQVMSFELVADSPALNGQFRTIAQRDVRARVDDLTGWVADGFEHGFMLDHRGATLDTAPLDHSFAINPFGLIIGELNYSLRWSAQVLIDTGGDYAFTIDSFHGHRLWIDGQSVADAFTALAQTSTTAPVTLAPGWHDVVLDVHKIDAMAEARARLTVASGPAWAGETIPADHVRPVMGRDVRWTGAGSTVVSAVPDGGSVTRTLSLELPPDFTPHWIEASTTINHPALPTMSVVLDPAVGANITMIGAGTATGSGELYDEDAIPTAAAGSSWSFIASDGAVDTVTGTLRSAAVTIGCAGGVAPFPTSARFESAVRDLGDVVGFGPVTWQLRQGATATLQLRTCDDAAACASEPWTLVVQGAVPAVTPRRFAQYAVDLASDGDTPVALDWFELPYSARP